MLKIHGSTVEINNMVNRVNTTHHRNHNTVLLLSSNMVNLHITAVVVSKTMVPLHNNSSNMAINNMEVVLHHHKINIVCLVGANINNTTRLDSIRMVLEVILHRDLLQVTVLLHMVAEVDRDVEDASADAADQFVLR